MDEANARTSDKDRCLAQAARVRQEISMVSTTPRGSPVVPEVLENLHHRAAVCRIADQRWRLRRTRTLHDISEIVDDHLSGAPGSSIWSRRAQNKLHPGILDRAPNEFGEAARPRNNDGATQEDSPEAATHSAELAPQRGRALPGRFHTRRVHGSRIDVGIKLGYVSFSDGSRVFGRRPHRRQSERSP